jgi:hypothetical protein
VGVLTERGDSRVSVWFENSAFAVYVLLTAITVYFHEPWSDEANSWLLGRDVSLTELWTRLMHYEGTPGLWQTILHGLIRLGVPYSGLNVFSGALGCAGAWMFIRKAPLPLAIRLAMPFTFYLFYQYSVVARSYCLLPVLLFVCGWLYWRAEREMGLLTVLLCLMAAVSVHGMMLSLAIWFSMHINEARRWRTLKPDLRRELGLLGLAYALVLFLLVWSAWPAPDVLFAAKRDYSLDHLWETTGETLANAFTGEWISSVVLIALCVPFLWRGRGLLMFALAAIGLCLFNSFVYANVWHEGMLFLAWLFAMWISGAQTKPKWVNAMAWAAMVAVIAVQGYWGFRTTAWDWKNPYSGAKEAARYLHDHNIAGPHLFGFGFASVGIQPYFKRNIFPNFRDGEPSGYYDWSEAYRNFEGIHDLAESKPEYVIVGYKDEEEKLLTRNEVKKSGYNLIQHFEGNLFWHDDVFEPDAFDLYQRSSQQ